MCVYPSHSSSRSLLYTNKHAFDRTNPSFELLMNPNDFAYVNTLESMSGEPATNSVESKRPVTLSGTSKDAKEASPLGLVDVGESPRAYLFQVSLPGVCKPQCSVKLDVRVDGRVEIGGLMQNSEFFETHDNNTYKPKVQQLAPSGNFHISFNLPGRVDPRLVSPTFRNTGILEVVVMKHIIPITQPNAGIPVPVPTQV